MILDSSIIFFTLFVLAALYTLTTRDAKALWVTLALALGMVLTRLGQFIF